MNATNAAFVGVKTSTVPVIEAYPVWLPAALLRAGEVEYSQGLITPFKTTHKQKNSRAFVAKHTKLTQQGTAKLSLLALYIQ